MKVIIDSLKTLFPYDISFEKIPSPKNKHFIAILLHRNFYHINIGPVSIIGIEPRKDEAYSVSVYKKHLSEYQEKLEAHCTYILMNPSQEQISSFIKNQIPFISDLNQIYLPFMGISLAATRPQKTTTDIEKMMPATQEVFLYLFYGNKKYYLKSEIADFLKISRTSLTRASEQLIAMNLVVQTKVGKEYRMELPEKGSSLYKKAVPYLINPVYDEFYVDSKELRNTGLIAGESALSKCSMMNPPKIPQIAFYKESKVVDKLKAVDIRWEDCEYPVKVQLWKYPPEIFAKEGRIDTVSMLCSLKAINDERIEGEIEEIVEEERW